MSKTIEERIDMQMFDSYRREKTLKAEYKNAINVVCEVDGTLTIRGVEAADLRSILTSASLYRYDEDKNPSHCEKEYREAIEQVEAGTFVPVWDGQLECMKENADSDHDWRVRQRALIEGMDEAIVESCKNHKDYVRMERLWFFLNNPFGIKWKILRFKRGWKKLTEKMNRD